MYSKIKSQDDVEDDQRGIFSYQLAFGNDCSGSKSSGVALDLTVPGRASGSRSGLMLSRGSSSSTLFSGSCLVDSPSHVSSPRLVFTSSPRFPLRNEAVSVSSLSHAMFANTEATCPLYGKEGRLTVPIKSVSFTHMPLMVIAEQDDDGFKHMSCPPRWSLLCAPRR